MNREELIIDLYLQLEAAVHQVTEGRRLRRRGPPAALTDAEILTIEIFGELQGHHDDAAIWRYAKAHWQDWFPGLGSYKAFVKQCANLSLLKEKVFDALYAPCDDVHITDGVPMPVCHYARSRRCKLFKGEAAFGFCAAKDERYYGFKGHVVVSLNRQVACFTLTAANIDERCVLDNLRGHLQGLLIGDKGLLSKTKQADLATDAIDMQTPLRDNMPDPRPKAFVRQLVKTRRSVETAIGQLVTFYDFARCKASTIHHLTAKLLRKILAYNFSLT